MNPEDCGGDEKGGEGEFVPAPEAGEAVAREVCPVAFDPERMKAVLEAVLHVSGQPLSLDRLASVVGAPGRRDVRELVDELNTEYLERGRAFEVVEVANGFQVRTRPEFAPWIAKLQTHKPVRLTRAALETLAIVAYKQPATRAEVEAIRGVDTGAVLGSLLEKRLVRVLGRKEIAGRPILYGTSQEFLDLFGLKNLASLPTLKEVEGMFEKQGDEEAAGAQDAAGPVSVGAASGTGGEQVSGNQAGVEAGVGVAPTAGGAGDPEPRLTGAGRVTEAGGAGLETGEGPGPGSLSGEPFQEAGGAGWPEDGGEEEAWEAEEGEGDLETAELDALLRAAKTKVVSYEDVVQREAEGVAEEVRDAREDESEVDGIEGEEIGADDRREAGSPAGQGGEGGGLGPAPERRPGDREGPADPDER